MAGSVNSPRGRFRARGGRRWLGFLHLLPDVIQQRQGITGIRALRASRRRWGGVTCVEVGQGPVGQFLAGSRCFQPVDGKDARGTMLFPLAQNAAVSTGVPLGWRRSKDRPRTMASTAWSERETAGRDAARRSRERVPAVRGAAAKPGKNRRGRSIGRRSVTLPATRLRFEAVLGTNGQCLVDHPQQRARIQPGPTLHGGLYQGP